LLGDQSVEGNSDSNPAGMAEAYQFTAIASGTVNQLVIYIDVTSTASQVVVGLYSNASNNTPNSSLTQSVIANPTKGAWNAVPVPSATITAGANYWIALLAPTGSGTAQFRNGGAGGKAQTSGQSNLTTLPTVWTPGVTYSDGPLSAYGVQQG